MDNELYDVVDEEEIVDDGGRKYLSFISDGLQYAINATYVIDIITNYQVTLLPRVPEFIKGIMNFRGQIIPVIDIKIRMGRYSEGYSETSCVIVLDVNGILLGMIVENVSNTITVKDDMVTPVPNNNQEIVYGIVKDEGTVNLLLDCESLVQIN